MTEDNFEEVVNEQINICVNTLVGKSKEYSKDEDKLIAFKRASSITGVNSTKALLGMLAKHIVSIVDMSDKPETYSLDKWTEKITDSVNYLLLLKGLVTELCGRNED